MPPRNLHEAFEQAEKARRRSGFSDSSRRPQASPPNSAGGGASTRSASAALAGASAAAPGQARAALRNPIAWVVLLATFGFGYLVGRGSGSTGGSTGEAQAASSGLERELDNSGPRALVPTESLGDSYLLDVKDELLDHKNQYTVQVVSYIRSDRNLGFAQDLVSHLASRDLPVAPAQRVGEYLVVLVGASPTKEALAALEARVRVLDDAAGKKSFGDARIISIDSLLERP